MASQDGVLDLYHLNGLGSGFVLTPGQYHWARLIAIVVLVVVIVVVLVVLIVAIITYVNPVANPLRPRPRLSTLPPVEQDPGATANGVADYYNGTELPTASSCQQAGSTWLDEVCICKVPWYGPRCDRPSHDVSYYAVGTVSPNGLNLTAVERLPGSIPLSFNGAGGAVDPLSCTGQCDQRDGCIGVHYSQGQCTLLLSNPYLNPEATITMTPEVESELYLYRQGGRPVIRDRVFGYTGLRPLRYWATTLQPPMVQTTIPGASPAGELPAAPVIQQQVETIWHDQVRLLTQAPSRLVNDGSLVGLWSRGPFEAAAFGILINAPLASMYVDRPESGVSDYSLELPPNLQQGPLYVMYRRIVSGPRAPAIFN